MTASYSPGQVLTAAELNASLNALVVADDAAITGGTIEGVTFVNITGTQDSTSPTTGALTVAGGVGVALDVQIGGELTVAGEGVFNANTASTSPTTGALVVEGGLGVGGAANIQGALDVNSSVSAQEFDATATTDSTNTTTGALTVAGGVGVAKTLNVGTNANVAGNLAVTGTTTVTGQVTLNGGADVAAPVEIFDANNDTAQLSVANAGTNGANVLLTGNGATTPSKTLRVQGGVFEILNNAGTPIFSATDAGAATVTGSLTVDAALIVESATDSTSDTTGALTVAGGVGVVKDVFIGGNVTSGGELSAVTAALSSATDSTSDTTGALTVAGGVGVVKDVFIGGQVNSVTGAVSGTTASTSPSTGALTVAGGVGVGGALNVQGAANISGAVGITGALTASGGIAGNLSVAGLIEANWNPNLLYNSSGELGTLGWATSVFAAGTDASAANGTWFENATALTAAGSDASNNIPVGAAVTLSLSASLNAAGVTSGVLAVSLVAYNSSNVSLGTVCSLAATNGTGWARSSVSGATPAGTAYVQVVKGITGGTVAVTASGAGFRRIKVEQGAFATMYSQEASISAGSGMSSTNPVIASGPLTFADGTQQYSASSGKNRLINGAMSLAQRASTSFAGTSASGYGGPDRWKCANTAGGAFTQSQNQSSFNGKSLYILQQSVTSPLTNLSTTSYWSGICQIIEAVNCCDLQGEQATLSFYFWASVTGTFSVAIRIYNAAGTAIVNSYVTQITVITANTPTKYVVTTPTIPTATAMGVGAAAGIDILIGAQNQGTLMSATANLNTWQAGNFVSAQNNTSWGLTNGASIYATNVQLEAGPDATPFEVDTYQVVFSKCLRYYNAQWSGYWAGYAAAATEVVGATINFNVMRAVPAVTMPTPSYGGVVNSATWASLGPATGIYWNASATAAGSYSFSTGQLILNAEL